MEVVSPSPSVAAWSSARKPITRKQPAKLIVRCAGIRVGVPCAAALALPMKAAKGEVAAKTKREEVALYIYLLLAAGCCCC